jgi:hypothetical protein
MDRLVSPQRFERKRHFVFAATIYGVAHCKKELAVFPSPAGMSLIKLFLGGNNLVFSRPERVWSVTSRLGTGKWLTLFYSAVFCKPTVIDSKKTTAPPPSHFSKSMLTADLHESTSMRSEKYWNLNVDSWHFPLAEQFRHFSVVSPHR